MLIKRAAEFDPRRARPGQQFTHTDVDGKEHNFRADSRGVLRPKHACEVDHADALDLPVARKAEAAKRSRKSTAAPATDEKEG